MKKNTLHKIIYLVVYGTYLLCSGSLVYSCSNRSKDNGEKKTDTSGVRISPAVLPNSGFLFVNHQANKRSGHGGQCITECTNGDLLAFYSNVDGDLNNGHNVGGWAEYKRSTDGGKTWSAPVVFEYSKKVWDEQADNKIVSLLIWEVETAPDGTVIAFGRSSKSATSWGGDALPVYFLSTDNGHTWSGPIPITQDPDPGISREEAALVYDGEIFVLYHDYYATDRKFRLYSSKDNGKTFRKKSVLPFPQEQWYGTMGTLPNGDLIVYTYNDHDDGGLLQYVTSSDKGITWSEMKHTKMAKRIRKPRMTGKLGGYYFMHGRSGSSGPDPRHFVLYKSKDGINWDEGVFLNKGGRDTDSYSANEIIGKYNNGVKPRLLLQASICYESSSGRVNLHHWFIDFE